MKIFIIKAINLGLICVILYGYQSYAMDYKGQIEEYEEDAVGKAWNEAGTIQKEEITENNSENLFQDGIYEGSGAGFGGEIRVQVEICDGKIFSVKILSAENETADYLKSAERILTDVVKKQSIEVDTISGATLSSNGILEGIRNALEDSYEK